MLSLVSPQWLLSGQKRGTNWAESLKKATTSPLQSRRATRGPRERERERRDGDGACGDDGVSPPTKDGDGRSSSKRVDRAIGLLIRPQSKSDEHTPPIFPRLASVESPQSRSTLPFTEPTVGPFLANPKQRYQGISILRKLNTKVSTPGKMQIYFGSYLDAVSDMIAHLQSCNMCLVRSPVIPHQEHGFSLQLVR